MDARVQALALCVNCCLGLLESREAMKTGNGRRWTELEDGPERAREYVGQVKVILEMDFGQLRSLLRNFVHYISDSGSQLVPKLIF